MTRYNYTGETTQVYVDFNDGEHTLEAVPGETYELLVAPDDGLFQAVAGKVSKAPETPLEAPTEPQN